MNGLFKYLSLIAVIIASAFTFSACRKFIVQDDGSLIEQAINYFE
jgi:hypothetical protein